MNGTDEFTNETVSKTEKTLEQTDKKCPACGGTLDFDPKSGELLCPYCGTIVEIEGGEEKNEDRAEELDFNEAVNTENCNWGTEKRVVICKSCGAETVYDASTVSGECPYCGSNQVMEAGDENIMAPGGVCPFKITPEEAGGSFIKWLKKKLFCPKEAKNSAKAGKMKGVYLPYWTFDADTHSAYTARYGRERVVRRGKETRVVIDWYYTSGTHDEFINDQLVSGTEKHDRKILSGIEPFDTENNVSYKPDYVAGFASERYSVVLKAACEKAKNFIKNRLFSNIERK
ncbi:MAG: TFIIB-type zinc ribbon-containing protein, partial [Eubacteriales bacterium]